MNASVRASHAIDVLADTVVVDCLLAVLQDCHLVFGTSTRTRELHWIFFNARAAAEKIVLNPKQKVAVVFGRETLWPY